MCQDFNSSIQSLISSRLFWDKNIEDDIHKFIFDKSQSVKSTIKYNDLYDELSRWGIEFSPIIIDAMNYYLDDDEFQLKCFGALIRDRARVDPDWFFVIAYESSEELYLLSKYIGQVEIYGCKFPGKIGWINWLKLMRDDPHKLTNRLNRDRWDINGRCLIKGQIDWTMARTESKMEIPIIPLLLENMGNLVKFD